MACPISIGSPPATCSISNIVAVHACTVPDRLLLARATIFERAPDGRVKQIIGVSSDITERKRQEEELRRLTDDLEVRVAERTANLVLSQNRLRALASELNLAEQRERKRLAGELHDYLAQMLVLGRLNLNIPRSLLRDSPLLPRKVCEIEFCDTPQLAAGELHSWSSPSIRSAPECR